jgi:DNA-binding transcriptional ArsR family regulator
MSAPTTAAAPLYPLFSALGDPNRLRIIVRLCDLGPSSTSQVTRVVPVTRQAASKHLQQLESAGLVTSSRRGRERIWTVQTDQLAQASDYLTQLSRRWDAAVDRLRAYVESRVQAE